MSEEELEKHVNYQWNRNIEELEKLARRIRKHSEEEEKRFLKQDEAFNIEACFN